MEMKDANIDDLAIVAEWIKSAEEAKLWGGPKIRYPISLDSLTEDIDFHDSPSFAFYRDQQLSGFVQIIDVTEGVGHIARVIINPELRGLRFGNRLIGDIINYCFLNSYQQLTLNVYQTNTAAIRLYQSHGFKVSATNEEHRSWTMTVFKDPPEQP